MPGWTSDDSTGEMARSVAVLACFVLALHGARVRARATRAESPVARRRLATVHHASRAVPVGALEESETRRVRHAHARELVVWDPHSFFLNTHMSKLSEPAS